MFILETKSLRNIPFCRERRVPCKKYNVHFATKSLRNIPFYRAKQNSGKCFIIIPTTKRYEEVYRKGRFSTCQWGRAVFWIPNPKLFTGSGSGKNE
jgi:hypothetical protein